MGLEFEAAEDISADGYLLIQKSGFGISDYPIDFTNYTDGASIGSSKVAAIITDDTQTSTTMTNLSFQSYYSYLLVPFNWDGSTSDSKNFYTSGNVPSLNAYTIPTLGEWGMIAFIGLVAIGGVFYIRRLA